MSRGSRRWRPWSSASGPGSCSADGTLNRPALADLAFADDESTAALEAITHPAIATEMQRRIDAAPADAVVVCDGPSC